MDPVTAIVVASALGGASAVQEGRNADAMSKSEQKWHDYNAEVERRNAKAALDAGEYETTQQRRQSKQLLTRQKAIFAKAGIEPAGSALAIQEDTAGQLELDIMMNRRNRMIESQQFDSSAQMSSMSGKMARARGKSAKKTSYLNAGSTILIGYGTAFKY